MFTLKDMSTRELLAAVQRARNAYVDEDGPDSLFVGTRILPGGVPQAVYATCEEIAGELKHRPHVSSTAEAKVIRRLRAQTGQTEEWLRAHSKYGQEIADAQNPNRRVVSAVEAKRLAPLYGAKYFGRLCKVTPSK